MEIGARVVRGPDWSSGEIDGGEGHLGTVVSLGGETTCEVLWDNGKRCICRIGTGGKHDLRVFDTGPAGNCQSGTCCNECGVTDICGTVWRCKTCDISLCCLCYGDMKHDITHLFRRFDTCTSKGVDVSPRCSSLRVQALGLFPGATVIKGSNWNEEEPEIVTESKIISVEDHPSGVSVRSMVRVEWGEEQTGLYRAGHEGKVDVQCVTEYPGTFYYREHLGLLRRGFEEAPPVSTERPRLLRSGDRVCIKVSLVRLQEMQRRAQLSDQGLQEFLPKFGSVKHYTTSGHVAVSFGGHVVILREEALKKVPLLTEGDTVRMCSDLEEVKLLQEGHGGFTDGMAATLGKVGIVKKVTSKGSVVVIFSSGSWQYNPACCIPAPGQRVDIVHDMETDNPDEKVKDTKRETDTDVGLKEKAEAMFDAFVNCNYSLCLELMRLDPRLKNIVHKGTTLLIQACGNGRHEFVHQLLNEGVDVNKRDSNNLTPLFIMILRDDLDMVKLLVERGCDVNVPAKHKVTPLHMCAKKGKTDFVRLLLSAPDVDLNKQDMGDNTPVHIAIEEREDAILKLFLASSANIDPTITNERHFNILQTAAIVGNYRAAERIVVRFPDVVELTMSELKYTALHIAANNDHTDCVRVLIDKGKANVDARNTEGYTPLHLACLKLHDSTVSLLVQKGADVNAQDQSGNTPLHLTLAEKHDDIGSHIWKMLLSKRTNNEARIQLACKLLKSGARMEIKNSFGQTALDAAKNDTIRKAVTMFIRGQSDSSTESATSTTQTRPAGKSTLTDSCSHCLSSLVDIQLRPCGHRFLCRKCVDLVEHCPFCKQFIQGFDNITDKGCKDNATSKSNDTPRLLRSGDRVCIKVSLVRLQEMQRRAQLSDQGLLSLIPQYGTVKNYTNGGHVTVSYGDKVVVLCEDALKKIPLLREGDVVRICKELDELMTLQEGHGGFVPEMANTLGKVGKVIKKIEFSGNVLVEFGPAHWVYNPACCTPAPGANIDNIQELNTGAFELGGVRVQVEVNVEEEDTKLDGETVTDAGLLHKTEGMFDALVRGNEGLCLSIMRLDSRLKNIVHHGKTILMLACAMKRHDFVRQLLDEGVDINKKDSSNLAPIFLAVMSDDADLAKILIQNGCDVSTPGLLGVTPIHMCVKMEKKDMVHIIMKGNPDLNMKDMAEDTPLHVAVESGNDDILKLLLSSSLNIDPTITNCRGFNLLQVAAFINNQRAVERIVEKFPEIVNTAIPQHKFTALHIAAVNDHADCARILMDKGKANVDPRSDDELTPLQLACINLKPNVVSILLQRGADVNAQDDGGNTGLHFVLGVTGATRGFPGSLNFLHGNDEARIRVACDLLKHGARVDIRNSNGQTALETIQSENIRTAVTSFIRSQSEATSATSEPTLKLPCSNCLTTLVDITLRPCGHRFLCRSCVKVVKHCPFCKQTIQGVKDTQNKDVESPQQESPNCKVQ